MSPPAEAPRGLSAALSRLAVARPVGVGMAFLSLTVLGLIALARIPLQMLPSGFSPPILYAHFATAPSTPEDLEAAVAEPVEELLGTVHGLQRQQTIVQSDSCGFLLQFVDGTDMELAYQEVLDRLDRAWPKLPPGSQRPILWKYNPGDDPILWLGVGLGAQQEPEALHDLLQTRLLRPLERLPGVSRAELSGTRPQVLKVSLDAARAQTLGVDTLALARSLAGESFAMAAGKLRHGGQVLPLRIPARLEDAETLGQARIPSPYAPEGVPLASLAELRREPRGEQPLLRIDGHPGLTVAIFKESQANTLEVAARVKAEIERLRARDPVLARLQVHPFFDQGAIIGGSLATLRSSGLWGGLLAVGVLLLFLRRPGITLIVALAIPLSLLFAVLALWARGGSLDILSMMGLMLSVGLVVDNAIVVAESIHVQRRSGHGPARAAQRGAAEVALALAVATGTTVVAFLPLVLMAPGEELSFLLGAVGFPVYVSLLASLAVALLLIPLASSLLPGGGEAPAAAALAGPRGRWASGYAALLGLALRRRADVALVVLGLLLLSGWAGQGLQVTDQLEGQLDEVRVRAFLPPQAGRADRQRWVESMERYFLSRRSELGLRTLLLRERGRSSVEAQVFLVPPEQQPLARDQLLARLKRELPTLAGVEQHLGWRRSGGQGEVTLLLTGPKAAGLRAIALRVAQRLESVEGVSSVDADPEQEGASELRYEVDRDLATRLGLSAFRVGATLGYATAGHRLWTLPTPAGELEVWLELRPEDRSDPRAVSALTVGRLGADAALLGSQGGSVDPGAAAGATLGQTASVAGLTHARAQQGFGRIVRVDRRTALELRLETSSKDLKGLAAGIDAALRGIVLPEGYEIQHGSRFQRLQSSTQGWFFALLLAITFVFLLMGVLFESALLPLAVLGTIPLALAGSVLGLRISATPFDTMASTGLVILVGIVVNNGIVLVDRINGLRAEGLPRAEALIEGCLQRVRPVLMTTATTICGLLPLALGTQGLVGIPYYPLARTVIGGLLVSASLTLVVVPVLYVSLEDLRAWSRRSVRRLRPGR